MLNPIFITGFPKSGSTLVTQLFNNLPSISLDIELHFAPFFLGMIHNSLLSGEIMTTVDKPDPLATRILNLSANDFAGYYEWGRVSFRNLHSGWYKGLRWGNNCKATIDFVPVLKKMFPKSTVITMIRDPRDVWTSIKLAKWDGLNHFSDMTYFLSRYRQVYELSKSDGVSLLRYEDLITDPQSAFDLIGETYTQALQGVGKVFRYRTLPIPKHKEFEDKILTERVGRYKRELPDYEISIIEDAFPDIIESHFK